MLESYTNFKDYIKVNEDGWTGYIHPAFREVPLAYLVNPDSFEKVRSSDTAEVYRYSVQLSNNRETLYLKKYPYRSLTDLVKHLLRPSRAKRAFDAGIMLQKHGVQTPEIVAFLQKKDGLLATENLLITREMKDATVISEVLESNQTSQGPISLKDRRVMIAGFGQTLGQMHSAGICHGDLRWGNIFAARQGSDWKFYLIDNERTRNYPLLPFWLRQKNLVQLNMTTGNLTSTERMRFWKSYIQTSNLNRTQSRNLIKAVLKRTHRRVQKRSRTHLGFRDGTLKSHWNIQSAQSGDRKGFLLTAFCKGDRAAVFLQQIDTLMDSGTVLKDDVAARVVRCTYNHWDIVIKRYNHQGFWHSLRHTIKGSRAKKCWRFGHLLTALKIPCAAPIGVIEEWKLGFIWRSYILNAFVEGPNIQNYLRQADLPEHKKHAVLEKTQTLAAQLAENNMIHNDFKHCNLLIHGDSPVLIDLDSMQKYHSRWILSLYKRKMDNKIRKRIQDGKSGF